MDQRANLGNMLIYNFVKISDLARKPTFWELSERLRELQRQNSLQLQATHPATGDGAHKEL